MDFTLKKYKELLQILIKKNYNFQTFDEFLSMPKDNTIILRHDVDLIPENSLKFAEIQHQHGVKGVYYFRAVRESWDERIISKIHDMGHEIGYHYENLSVCKGNYQDAIIDFEDNLAKLRRLASVSTICMHGSPMSKFDSKDLWKKFDYKDFGIKGEPYFDTDFSDVYYLTDTGRRWDGDKVSVRDKVNSNYKLSFSTTNDIIESIIKKEMPSKVMFTFHPQRWHDNYFYWTKELIYQNFKNLVKRLIYVK